jgi:hypothetical protein
MNKLFSFISIIIFTLSSSLVHGQDFTVNELMQLRTSSLSNFETVVMGKGYILNDIDKEYDHYVTFKKDHNTISYGYIKGEHFQEIDTVIIYLLAKEEEYNKLKASVKENAKHPNKTHFFKNEKHILHVNLDNGVVAHFFTKYNERPLYEVEITTMEADKYNYMSKH